VALASLATTFIIPAIASPAAPVAAAATVVIGAIGTGLVIGSALNSIDLVRQELKADTKMQHAKAQIKEAVVPHLSDKSYRKRQKVELEKLKESKELVSDVAKQALGVESDQSHLLPLETEYIHHPHQSMHDALVEELKKHEDLKKPLSVQRDESESLTYDEASCEHHKLR
jgi:hypothetical protein